MTPLNDLGDDGGGDNNPFEYILMFVSFMQR